MTAPVNEKQYETLTVEIADKVAHIQLSRPDAMNSMVPAFWKELPDAVRSIDHHASARAIVISSQGKHFSAGMDLSVFTSMAEDFSGEPARRAERLRRLVFELQDSFNALEAVRMPVLGAVQGGAIGGAVDLLCACDMRYCTEDAFFTIKETQIGMTADLGTLQRLPRLMPVGLVKELAYTGRNFGANEALEAGFVNQVYASQDDMLESVMKIARLIAAQSPMAVTGTKQMINYALDHSLADSLNHMATWQSGMFQMPDIQAAMQAQKTGTPASFDDLHDCVSRMQSKTN
ncbi:crotonase/enoyl-CoA hydratase family protein [Alteromonas sp. H39]|uniref:crotonase/enoyl-CoA hydratase family protein n=1 Tax=Alteromonas sp. H39 TaxID=3389876 RepID=UPI0039E1008A